jgi:hypothetical protein
MADETDERPETTAERDERVRLAEEDRAKRAKKAPVTGALSFHDVIRHLIHHGPARSPAEADELLAVVDTDDPDTASPHDEELKAQPGTPAAPDLTLSERDELERLRRDQETRGRDNPARPAADLTPAERLAELTSKKEVTP